MKLTTPTRPNFSRYAKLCDQTFYHDSSPVNHPIEQPLSPRPKPPSSTTAFTSVARQTRGNFAFPIRLPKGQFSHHPNHSYGKNRNPSWSFSKTQRYKKQPLIEFQVCEKHPLLNDHELKMRASSTSMRQSMKDQVRLMRSTGFSTSRDKNNAEEEHHRKEELKMHRNYSIVSPRDTSSVGFYASSKIAKPKYLSKQDLNKAEGQLDEKNYQKKLKPSPNGYIQFSKRRARHPNRNSKGFQTYLYAYQHQKQFNNFSETQYPTGPVGHIDMQIHLDRPSLYPQRLGPNTEPFKIDSVRVSDNKINLNLATFRDQIITRYDRVGAQPNTRLDYDAKAAALGGLLKMNRMLCRNPELFPIVDPAIKKAGDRQMKDQLKKCIPVKEINEALRPKNVENYTMMLQENQA